MSAAEHIERARARLAAGDDDGGGLLERYAADPVAFALEVLSVRLTDYQARVLRSIVEHRRVAWRSGHKVGKSTMLAVAALWWACTRPRARVIIVAPTSRQVRGVVWKEVARVHRGARSAIGGELHDTPDRGLQFADGREVVGFSTDQPERVAGFSGPAMMFLCDEASGITEDLFAAIAGNLAGGGRLLLTGNPTRTSGTFYDAHTRKSDFYCCFHTSSRESPNVTGEGEGVPGMATREWCDEMLAEWGEGSPLYQVRVKGEFPTQAENAVIALEVVEAARARWSSALATGATFEQAGRLEVGVDVARFGSDESVIFARRGNVALAPWTFRQLDTVALAARVLDIVQRLRRHDEVPIVRVDVIGVGAGVVDQLQATAGGAIELVAVNVGEVATVATYARKRDEVWFALRDWLRGGGALPPDAKLEGELVAPIYSFTPAGKVQVESKDAMRARLKRSPDRADALGLATYSATADESTADLWCRLPDQSDAEQTALDVGQLARLWRPM